MDNKRKANESIELEAISTRGGPRRKITGKKTQGSVRAIDYYTQFGRLNACVAQHLLKRKHQIQFCIENSQPIPDHLLNVDHIIEQYLFHASNIKQRLSPESGALCAFGSNEFGMIAQREGVDERYRPALISSMKNQTLVQVQCGGQHSVCLTEDGNVSTWGCNDEGSLGSKLEDTAYAPIRVTQFLPSSEQGRVEGITDPVFTWRDFSNAKPEIKDPLEIKIDPKYEDTIIDVASGDTHCLALAASGRVYFWGSYKDVEGKNWADIQPSDDPRKVEDKDAKYFTGPKGKRFYPIHVSMLKHKVIAIACGFVHNAVIVEVNQGGVVRNKLVTWGMGEKGQLARPVFTPVKKTPEEIEQIPDEVLDSDRYVTFHVDKVESDYMPPKFANYSDGVDRHVEKVACGGYHTLVLAKSDKDGFVELFAAGLNNYGQLGISDGYSTKEERVKLSDKTALTKVDFFTKRGISISQIAAGEHHSLCVDASCRRLFAFGRSCSGQLGHTGECPKPGAFEVEPVEIFLEKDKENPIIEEISCGSFHSFVVTADGDVWSWGSGFHGQLGIGKLGESEDVVTLPTKADVLSGINKVRSKNNELQYQKAKVLKVAGGSQSSALIAMLK
ncbi:hypothetical protein CTEN210_04233 [Chaetoceros tenuissimus]|uniref:RCC1-like domain-containing protein n=1 Tax=Chaetoceros tenuissimus TaxID=426638 RepID=A0AAD3CLH0_9STRA|nr:hypothetical protein CTEN210_04233 [Chaetoceros tenuissimus]